MDVRYINPFVDSICNTVTTMCGMGVTVGKPGLKTGEYDHTDVTATIGFSGDAAGSVTLCFPFETASKIATSFAGTEITPEHADFGDALGELANMVAGGAKAKLEGVSINISLPTVIIGKSQQVSASRTAPRLVIPCSTEAGCFHVEVGMELSKAVPVARQPSALGAKA